MKSYNGHRSWNAWNVSLWISNTESIYNYAMDCIKWAKRWADTCRPGYWDNKQDQKTTRIISRATRIFMKYYQKEKTPDGATYNHLSVKLALEGLIDD